MLQTTALALTGRDLQIEQVVQISRHGHPVTLGAAARAAVDSAAAYVQRLAAGGDAVYGITTGFGKLASVRISPSERAQLQQNLLRSHAVGVGRPYDPEVVRAMMLLRANSLALGHSGIRPATLDLLLEMLNRGVVPVIPAKGSVGASGDLAPLAHMALVLTGEGEAWVAEARLPGGEALTAVGLQPVTLGPKEGLALINGTQAMAALGALAVHDGRVLARTADVVAALTLEALHGVMDAFDPRIQQLRPHPGQSAVAANLGRLVQGSERVVRQAGLQVQDAYSLRCIPQVHGASRDALAYVQGVVQTEINAATDNPLLFPETETVLSGGNFHGQPLALALDFLAIALAELAGIAERRVERLLNPALSHLPAFLSPNGGVNSGLMIAQYTAAALVSENKVLAHPASVDSIPTSANQEDHVSMGNIAARKAREVLYNATRVLAIEAICAAQAVDLAAPAAALGRGTAAAHACLRQVVPPLGDDRCLAADLEAVARLIADGDLLAAAQAATESLA